jgi:hypothetical protein
MPELDAKTRTTASASRRTTNGISHHFFSRAQNRKNSRKTVHIDANMIAAGRDSVECQFQSGRITVSYRLETRLFSIQPPLPKLHCDLPQLPSKGDKLRGRGVTLCLSFFYPGPNPTHGFSWKCSWIAVLGEQHFIEFSWCICREDRVRRRGRLVRQPRAGHIR